MPVIANTAYPRLSAHPPPAELETAFTPTAAEIAFAARRTRQPVPRLALLVLLKAFQRLGYFPMLAAVPAAVVEHIARGAGVLPTDDIAAAIAAYDGTTYRVRLAGLVRTYLGVIPYDRSARATAVQVCLEAARTRDDLADIINAAIEELVRCRYELPAFDTVLRIARTARALVNRGYYRRVAATLSTEMRGRLLDLLAIPAGETRSAWDRVKTEPKRPSPQRMREFIAHLQWLREQCVGANAFAGVPDQKIRQFAAEARTLNAAALSAVVEPKRLTLVAALLRRQAAQALDDLADMFIRLTQRMHNRAKVALAEHQARHAEETDALVALLRETVLACRDAGEGQARLAAVEALLLPDAEGILERCEAHAAIAGNNHLPLLARFYKGQRAAFLRFLEQTGPVTTSQDRATEQAIAFLLAHRTHRHPKLRTIRGDGKAPDAETRLVSLSFVGEKWWPLVTGQKAREPEPVQVDRRYFEICLFSQVMAELKSGDLCIPGSDDYADYRDQLVSWEDYDRDVAAYAEQAGVSADAATFVHSLKARLVKTAASVDRDFPGNTYVEIHNGEPVVKRLRARPDPDGAGTVERLIKERLAPLGILEALVETEHWLGWTRHFGPISGFEAKLDRPRERYLATAFCYGCGLGPTQAARSLKGLDRRQVAFINQRHVTEETLDKAIVSVIDAYAGLKLHRHWGTGRSASADGTKWDVHPQSLMSEYHIRYGGYGGIGYYLVSDTYIALFSRFIACGAWEGNTILDFVSENRSEVQPDTIHADTQGQSAPIFGLALLLGIELMPRIRNWQDLHLYRPDPTTRYTHIDDLFTATIDWELIETHLPDMLRVALSIKAGRLLPSAILRRLGTYSRKNRLYFAFRELGRVVRTDFLLRYLSSLELRRLIQSATNKSELFNRYAQWVSFGGGGLVAAATRDEQRKMIKYNHLIANLLIFHTLVGMTRALDQLAAEGRSEAWNGEALATLSPYQTEHINRFGNYVLDLGKPPLPLPVDLSLRIAEPGPPHVVTVPV